MIFKKKKVKPRKLTVSKPTKDYSWLDKKIKKAKQKGKEYDSKKEWDFLYSKKKIKHTPSPQEEEMEYIEKKIWRK